MIVVLGDLANADQFKDGFRDLVWGQAVTKDFQKIPELKEFPKPDCIWYSRPADQLQIGDFPISAIRYCFEEKVGLKMVQINLPQHSAANLMAVFLRTYGLPKEYDKDEVRASWHTANGVTVVSVGAANAEADMFFANSEFLTDCKKHSDKKRDDKLDSVQEKVKQGL